MTSSQACSPKPLRSSSKQAAGRARPSRGPRVPRKPQAAQVEPGRRHRKSRVSSLPFLHGDLVTGKREVRPERRQPASAGPVPDTRLLRPCSSEGGPRGAAGGGGGGRRPRPSRFGRGPRGGSSEEPGGETARAAGPGGGGAKTALPPATLRAATWGAAEMADPWRWGANSGRVAAGLWLPRAP